MRVFYRVVSLLSFPSLPGSPTVVLKRVSLAGGIQASCGFAVGVSSLGSSDHSFWSCQLHEHSRWSPRPCFGNGDTRRYPTLLPWLGAILRLCPAGMRCAHALCPLGAAAPPQSPGLSVDCRAGSRGPCLSRNSFQFHCDYLPLRTAFTLLDTLVPADHPC